MPEHSFGIRLANSFYCVWNSRRKRFSYRNFFLFNISSYPMFSCSLLKLTLRCWNCWVKKSQRRRRRWWLKNMQKRRTFIQFAREEVSFLHTTINSCFFLINFSKKMKKKRENKKNLISLEASSIVAMLIIH